MHIINKIIKKLIRILSDNVTFRNYKASYSQSGEDMVTQFIFDALNIKKPSYLDIGANHPIRLNNTYSLYKKGSKGVLIEPDPYLFKKIRQARRKDICLNVGIGINETQSAEFYIMSTKTLNTFSKSEAGKYIGYGTQKIEQVINIPMITINTVIEKYFKESPDFLSIDIEGLDFEIIKTMDFSRYRPIVVCLETLTYTENRTEQKADEIIQYMLSNGYFVYADTYINTVFVDKAVWFKRQA